MENGGGIEDMKGKSEEWDGGIEEGRNTETDRKKRKASKKGA